MSRHPNSFSTYKVTPNHSNFKGRGVLEKSTDSVDTCESQRDHQPRHQCKIKVELCKNYSERGHCPYGKRCRFAHGVSELQQKDSLIKFRTRPCRVFTEQWECRFGSRCNFQHGVRGFKEVMGSSELRTAVRVDWPQISVDMTERSRCQSSRLMQLLGRSHE